MSTKKVKEDNKVTIDKVINILEKDAAVMVKLTEMNLMPFTNQQREILLGLSKASLGVIGELKAMKHYTWYFIFIASLYISFITSEAKLIYKKAMNIKYQV